MPITIYGAGASGASSARISRNRARTCSWSTKWPSTSTPSDYLWAKQIDCSLFFAQAVSDETVADLFGNWRYQPLLIALVGEGMGVAQAAGITPRGFDGFDPLPMRPRNEAEAAAARAVLDRFAGYCRGLVKVRSGPWRDLAIRKRLTEVDHLMGWIIAEGRARGVPVPLNERLLAQVKELERGVRQRGLHNLDELESARAALYDPAIGPR